MQCVIFVHPTLSVDYMLRQARKRGCAIVSIITALESTRIEVEFLHTKSDFVFTGSANPENDLPGIKNLLHEEGLIPFAIINGIDSAIYYTDFLQRELLGYNLNLEASRIRLNKYQVNRTLAASGLKTIPGIEIQSKGGLDEKLSIIKTFGLPLVAKPSENTAAMSGFRVLERLDDLERYLDEYLGAKNPYYVDQFIDKVLVQKYIPENAFSEYIIDAVSFDGHHHCCGIVEERKSRESADLSIYRYCVPHNLRELPQIEPVIDYVRDCLDALQVRYGITHNEVFWNAADQFFLVESNSRVPGNALCELYDIAFGRDPLKDYFCLADHHVLEEVPHRKSFGLTMDLYNRSTERATRINVEDIASFREIIHFRKPDPNPADFYLSYTRADHISASILLANNSPEQLERDAQTILDREQQGTLFLA